MGGFDPLLDHGFNVLQRLYAGFAVCGAAGQPPDFCDERVVLNALVALLELISSCHRTAPPIDQCECRVTRGLSGREQTISRVLLKTSGPVAGFRRSEVGLNSIAPSSV